MKTSPIRLALAQINVTVGDLEGNRGKIEAYIHKAEHGGADIVVFPELALTGYPPEDLVLKPKFIRDTITIMEDLSLHVKQTVVIAGFADMKENNVYNAAAVLCDGKIQGVYYKSLLPNYGVFDEKRYFTPGETNVLFQLRDIIFGITICEDIWYPQGPVSAFAGSGAKLILNINASPYSCGKIKERESIVAEQAARNRVHIGYCNLVGGQDELVFDGQSMVCDARGAIISRGAAFKEDLIFVDLDIPGSSLPSSSRVVKISTGPECSRKKDVVTPVKIRPMDPVEEIYGALTLGLKDYVFKNGFKKVVIGLSGGIDSSLVAVLAVDALGKENVTGVFMPSRYSSKESFDDAFTVAENLGIKFLNISIDHLYRLYLMSLEAAFTGFPRNIAEENLQARIRGTILMALSNKFGWLVLTTGNKSEMSTGYATLYGDMAGGFAVIKDVPKLMVYKLSKFRNSPDAVIPERVFTKPPTAELRPDQKDSDMLGSYDVLDPILKAYIEEDKSAEEIIALGFEKDTVLRILAMVDAAEYKRRQSPPGIKITPRAFGRDRRMPITNRYKG
ncbi:MAG: NAD+ synthase [Candidatus Omnitrophica bacterium]|nr:NAD+ synthase [Candidatus Omnitrophota bacterium]